MIIINIFREAEEKMEEGIPRNMRLAEIMAELAKYQLVVEVQKS